MLLVIYTVNGTKQIEVLDWMGLGDPLPDLKRKYQTEEVDYRKINTAPPTELLEMVQDILANS